MNRVPSKNDVAAALAIYFACNETNEDAVADDFEGWMYRKVEMDGDSTALKVTVSRYDRRVSLQYTQAASLQSWMLTIHWNAAGGVIKEAAKLRANIVGDVPSRVHMLAIANADIAVNLAIGEALGAGVESLAGVAAPWIVDPTKAAFDAVTAKNKNSVYRSHLRAAGGQRVPGKAR